MHKLIFRVLFYLPVVQLCFASESLEVELHDDPSFESPFYVSLGRTKFKAILSAGAEINEISWEVTSEDDELEFHDSTGVTPGDGIDLDYVFDLECDETGEYEYTVKATILAGDPGLIGRTLSETVTVYVISVESIDGYVYGESGRKIADMQDLSEPANVVVSGYMKFKADFAPSSLDGDLYYKWTSSAGTLTDSEGTGDSFLTVKWDAPDGHEQDVTLTLEVKVSESGPTVYAETVDLRTIRPHVVRLKFVDDWIWPFPGNEQQITDGGDPEYDATVPEVHPVCYERDTDIQVEIDLAGDGADDSKNNLTKKTKIKVTGTLFFGGEERGEFDEDSIDGNTENWELEDYNTVDLHTGENLPDMVGEYEDFKIRWVFKVKDSNGNWVIAYEEVADSEYSQETNHSESADGKTYGLYVIYNDYKCDDALFTKDILDLVTGWAQGCDKVDTSNDATNIPRKIQLGVKGWHGLYGYVGTGIVDNPFTYIPAQKGDCITYADLMTKSLWVLGVNASSEYIECKKNGKVHYFYSSDRTPHWLLSHGDCDGDGTKNRDEPGFPGTIKGTYLYGMSPIYNNAWRSSNAPWNFHGASSCAGHWWEITFYSTPDHDTEANMTSYPNGPVIDIIGHLLSHGGIF